MFSGYMRIPSYSQQQDGAGHVPNISFKKLRTFPAEV